MGSIALENVAVVAVDQEGANDVTTQFSDAGAAVNPGQNAGVAPGGTSVRLTNAAFDQTCAERVNGSCARSRRAVFTSFDKNTASTLFNSSCTLASDGVVGAQIGGIGNLSSLSGQDLINVNFSLAVSMTHHTTEQRNHKTTHCIISSCLGKLLQHVLVDSFHW